MKIKKTIIISILYLFVYSNLTGQNDVLFNHYMFNEISFNPSVSGFSSGFEASLLTRQQWLGFADAPCSQFLNLQTYQKNIGGLGLNIINDKLGVENTLSIKALYAHHVQLNTKSFLSLGIGVGVLNKNINGAKLEYKDGEDEDALKVIDSRIKADFNFGVEFNNPNLTLGIATTHISQFFIEPNNFYMPHHFYAYGKYRFKPSEKINIIPALLIKSSVFITQYDINSIFYFDNKCWIGASYRVKEAYVGIIGFNISKNIKFSYAYDFTLGNASLYNVGSHEVMLSYASSNNNRKKMLKSPRYFN